MVLIKKKEGISAEQFRSHYESVHVPLVLSITNRFSKYVRNYVDEQSSSLHPVGAEATIDVITECSFASQESFDGFRKDLRLEREGQGRISADELNFMERESIQMFVVRESDTDISFNRRREE